MHSVRLPGVRYRRVLATIQSTSLSEPGMESPVLVDHRQEVGERNIVGSDWARPVPAQ